MSALTTKEDKLNEYASLVVRYNELFNLTCEKTKADFLNNQVNEIVYALSYFENYNGEVLYDIGSGAGLPGIVLSIFMDETEFVLVERSKKRANFLRMAVNLLSLYPRVKVEEKELSSFKNSISVVTFRALSNFSHIEKDLYNALKPNGVALLFKGKLSSIMSDNYSPDLWKVDISQYEFLQKQRAIVKLSILK